MYCFWEISVTSVIKYEMIYSEGISMRHEDPSSPIDALKDFVHATEERAISIEIVDIVTSIDSASSRNTKHFFLSWETFWKDVKSCF